MGTRQLFLVVLLLLLWGLHCPARAQGDASALGSPSFCLFELPPEGDQRVWMNLSFVQYIELRSGELRVFYLGGNFGSGPRLRVPVANQSEGLALIKRMQAAAASCLGDGPR
jgi:hypothetical protein